ncbi:MAG TPA: hypothetical protein VF807_15085 [Ktedonobacterales bacterium]
MTTAIRWRIIVLQVVAILVLALGAVAGIYASNFTNAQIHDQLAPQEISFPQDAQSGLPSNLTQYAGQQVLNGDQAHAYAEKFIGLHLKEIGQDHPYSYWSGVARAETDPAAKAKDQAIADTLFKGETLRSMLNQAWTFSVMAQIAFLAGIGMAVAAAIVLVALAFEAFEMLSGRETLKVAPVIAASSAREPASVR